HRRGQSAPNRSASDRISVMEYVVLAVVLLVLALVGGLALLAPRLRRPPALPPTRPSTTQTIEAPTVEAPAVEEPTTPAPPDERREEQLGPPVAEVPAPALLETPQPTAGRLVRLRARLARSQTVFGKGLLAVLSRDRLDDETWDEVEEILIGAD